jgi:hypothetical protein
MTQGTEALAGEASINVVNPSDVVKDMQPIVGGTPLSMAFVPSKTPSREPQFSSDEFRPRTPSLLEAPTPAGPESMNRSQALPLTSAWQRLADYRSQGRVQLLTLWESKRSTVSLQAGKHGGPSLQWSSRLMNRGGATRGLLDRFVASSLGAAGLGYKAVARSPGTPTNKGINLLLPMSKSP